MTVEELLEELRPLPLTARVSFMDTDEGHELALAGVCYEGGEVRVGFEVERQTQAIELRVRILVDVDRTVAFIRDAGFGAADPVSLVRDEIQSNLDDQDYILEVDVVPV